MGRLKRMRNLFEILTDKVSILLLSSKPTNSFHVAVLRSTTHHHPSDPPPLDAVLSLVNHYRPSTSGILIHALLRRVHATDSVYVALKCLLTLHHVTSHGSPALKDQVSAYSSGPLFNLSTFMDNSDPDTCQLSHWVRWYADVIAHVLALSKQRNREGERLKLLVGVVERICGAPDTLHYQRISLVYEVMKLVGEDYRLIMREISTLINQLGTQSIQDMSDEVIKESLGDLRRLEDCKEKVFLMFLNKKRNDGVWELVGEVRKGVEDAEERRENAKLVFEGSESTWVGKARVNESRSVAIVATKRGRRWLDVDWNPIVASTA